MDRSAVTQRVWDLAEPVALARGLELVDVRFRPEGGRTVLRLLVDRPEGGVTLDALSGLSRELGDLLDVHDAVPGRYHLECSSPGLNRPLRKREDFQKHVGIGCVLKTREPIRNQRNYRGTISSLEGDVLMLLDRTSGLVAIPLYQVQSAKLDPET